MAEKLPEGASRLRQIAVANVTGPSMPFNWAAGVPADYPGAGGVAKPDAEPQGFTPVEDKDPFRTKAG